MKKRKYLLVYNGKQKNARSRDSCFREIARFAFSITLFLFSIFLYFHSAFSKNDKNKKDPTNLLIKNENATFTFSRECEIRLFDTSNSCFLHFHSGFSKNHQNEKEEISTCLLEKTKECQIASFVFSRECEIRLFDYTIPVFYISILPFPKTIKMKRGNNYLSIRENKRTRDRAFHLFARLRDSPFRYIRFLFCIFLYFHSAFSKIDKNKKDPYKPPIKNEIASFVFSRECEIRLFDYAFHVFYISIMTFPKTIK